MYAVSITGAKSLCLYSHSLGAGGGGGLKEM